MTEIPFREAPFPITGGTAELSLDARFGQRINVGEFYNLHTGSGAFGEGTGNDSPCFQAAFDLAFGSSGSPHGGANKSLNRPVEIPPGNFRCEDTLDLTHIVGGNIYGAGRGPTRLFYAGPMVGSVEPEPLLRINGATGLRMKDMELVTFGTTGYNTCVIDLDWDGIGSGGEGLNHNLFSNMSMGGGEHSIIIARSDNEGNNNMFQHCNVGGNGTEVGIDVRGAAAFDNSAFGGGGVYSTIYVRCPVGGGSFHAQCMSVGGLTSTDFVMESGHVMHLGQIRTESTKFLRLEDGIVTVQAFTNAGGDEIIEVNGGRLNIEGSDIGYTTAKKIIGTGGQISIQAIRWHEQTIGPSAVLFADYSGTVVWDPDGWVP